MLYLFASCVRYIMYFYLDCIKYFIYLFTLHLLLLIYTYMFSQCANEKKIIRSLHWCHKINSQKAINGFSTDERGEAALQYVQYIQYIHTYCIWCTYQLGLLKMIFHVDRELDRELHSSTTFVQLTCMFSIGSTCCVKIDHMVDYFFRFFFFFFLFCFVFDWYAW